MTFFTDTARTEQCRSWPILITIWILGNLCGGGLSVAADANNPQIGLQPDDGPPVASDKPSSSPSFVDQFVIDFMKEEDGDVHGVGIKLQNLAVSYGRRGRIDLALPLYKRALITISQSVGPDHPSMAYPLSNLGRLYHGQGQLEQALSHFEQAIAILEQHVTADSFKRDTFVANGFVDHGGLLKNVTDSLGGLYRDLGQYETAMKLYNKALNLATKKWGADAPPVANSLTCIAAVYHDQGEFRRALRYYQRSLAIRQKGLRPNHMDIAHSLNDIARLHHDCGRFDQALPRYERALKIMTNNVGRDHSNVATILFNLASLYRAKGNEEEALPMFERALAIVETRIHTAFAGLTSNERLVFVQFLRRYLDHWLAFTRDVDEPAYAEVLRFKGMVTRATAVEWRAARYADPHTHSLLDELTAANAALAKLSTAVHHDPKQIDVWKKRYAQAEKYRDDLSRQLAHVSAEYRGASQRLKLSVTDVQAQLKAHERLVDFVRYGNRYAVWVVAPEGRPVRIELGDAESIEQAIVQFRQVITGPSNRPAMAAPRSDHAVFFNAGRALSKLVWEPLSLVLGDSVTTVYVVPDAAMATVPFAALPAPESRHSATGAFLIDLYTLAYLSFAQDLVPWGTSPAPGQGLLAVGGVDYEQSQLTLPGDLSDQAKAIAKLALSDTQTRHLQRSAPGDETFLPLPGTQLEVRAVMEQFGAIEVDQPRLALYGPYATEDLLRKLGPGRRILHFATHGHVDTVLPSVLDRNTGLGGTDQNKDAPEGTKRHVVGYDPMLLSYLVMAGFNQRNGGAGHDGALTALEASSLYLEGVQLAVLSACNTAAGTTRSGEGVLGLVRGFQQAGVRTVVASLWPVDDQATSAFMQRFYRSVLAKPAGLTPAEALNNAGQAMRLYEHAAHEDQTGLLTGHEVIPSQRPFDAPRHWAAFVAYGPLR